MELIIEQITILLGIWIVAFAVSIGIAITIIIIIAIRIYKDTRENKKGG